MKPDGVGSGTPLVYSKDRRAGDWLSELRKRYCTLPMVGAVMRRVILLIAAVSLLALAQAEAGGSGFLARFLARSAIAVARQANTSHTTPTAKSYSPGVLTVDGLVACLKKAQALDIGSKSIEEKRAVVQHAASELDRIATSIEATRARVNTNNDAEVDRFNASIDRYNSSKESVEQQQTRFNRLVSNHNAMVETFNTECAKEYYADDMERARQLAGL